MIYKIEFDPKLGSWLVKIQKFMILWVSACEDGEPLRFSNYSKAQEWVRAVGLDAVYRNYADVPSGGFHAGYQPQMHYQVAPPQRVL